jgi:hypothetical protein
MTNPVNTETPEQNHLIIKSLQNVIDDYKSIIYGATGNNSVMLPSSSFNISLIESLFITEPLFLRKVLMLHFIIMYYGYSYVQYYIELLLHNYGLINVNLVINYSLDYSKLSSFNYTNEEKIFNEYNENSFKAIHVAALWSSDHNVVRLLYSYGANMWSRDLRGYYADELTNTTLFYDHLMEYYAPLYSRGIIINLYCANRDPIEFIRVNQEISLLAGETIPSEIGLNNWSPPQIIGDN